MDRDCWDNPANAHKRPAHWRSSEHSNVGVDGADNKRKYLLTFSDIVCGDCADDHVDESADDAELILEICSTMKHVDIREAFIAAPIVDDGRFDNLLISLTDNNSNESDATTNDDDESETTETTIESESDSNK